MLSDFSSAVIGFSSISHTKREAIATATQTTQRSSSDKDTQAVDAESSETQTEFHSSTPAPYNEKDLAAFLKKIEPLLQEELETVVNFSELENDGDDDESTMTQLSFYPKPPNLFQAKVSSISWNSTGGTLAVGFSAVRHDTWCCHKSSIVLYNANSMRASTTAPRTFNTDSCVTTVNFHPIEPSILAAGFYSGELMIYDLRKDSDLAVLDCTTEHSSQVVNILWSRDAECSSVGADGLIVLRKLSITSRQIKTVERFCITRGSFNPKLPNQEEGLEIMAVGQLGDDKCVVGVGGGGLLHCSMSGNELESRRPGFKDPVVQAYLPHNTVITAIRPGLGGKTFATVSSDGQMRVYRALEPEPRCVIDMSFCLLDLFWTEKAGIFGLCGPNRNISFVNVPSGEQLPLTLLLTTDSSPTVAEVILQRGIVAIGDSQGNVELWRVVVSKRRS